MFFDIHAAAWGRFGGQVGGCENERHLKIRMVAMPLFAHLHDIYWEIFAGFVLPSNQVKVSHGSLTV